MDPTEDETRPPPLTRSRTVRTALRLVDEQGLEALTMRALATELKVSPMALYNHVRDKEELVDLMLDLTLAEVDCSGPCEDDPWTPLRELVCNIHKTLTAHPHLARVYSNRIRIGPNALRIIERALRLLLDAGFPAPEAAGAFLALYTYTIGLHQMGRVMPVGGGAAKDDTEYYLALPPEQIPSIRRVSPYLGGVHQPGVFEFGLDTLLTGLRVRLGAATASDGTTDQP